MPSEYSLIAMGEVELYELDMYAINRSVGSMEGYVNKIRLNKYLRGNSIFSVLTMNVQAWF